MLEVTAEPKKVFDENFMMSMFQEYINELPPFKDYWTNLIEKKPMIVVASDSGTKVLQFAELKNDLFNPRDNTNADTDERLVKLSNLLLKEFLMSYTTKRRLHGSTCQSQEHHFHGMDALML